MHPGILHFQLKETPDDFFVDAVSRSNFLTASLQHLFSNVNAAAGVSPEVRFARVQPALHLARMFSSAHGSIRCLIIVVLVVNTMGVRGLTTLLSFHALALQLKEHSAQLQR
jgi:hypothetical protein